MGGYPTNHNKSKGIIIWLFSMMDEIQQDTISPVNQQYGTAIHTILNEMRL